jgi:hypothetical protein
MRVRVYFHSTVSIEPIDIGIGISGRGAKNRISTTAVCLWSLPALAQSLSGFFGVAPNRLILLKSDWITGHWALAYVC